MTTNFLWLNSSSFIGRTSYVGFFIDWFIVGVCSAIQIIIITTTGSMYIGIFLYIHGMVEDLKMRILSINTDILSEKGPTKQNTWPFYIEEIDLNVEIIK